MSEQREPTSVTCIGRFIVKVYDEQAYAENIRQYYGDDVPTTTQVPARGTTTFEKKKPAARYNWTHWRGGPMIEEKAV